jgi:hypothetical protein
LVSKFKRQNIKRQFLLKSEIEYLFMENGEKWKFGRRGQRSKLNKFDIPH